MDLVKSILLDELIKLNPEWSAPIDHLKTLFAQAATTTSPLILDLDGDGVETVSKTANIHFDHDGNGFAEQTGWAGRDDGLLVRDLNGNGTIDSGRELFGNHTRLANGAQAANGFVALAELDGNHDGKLDAQDAAYADLRIWQDANQDGITAAGELHTLTVAGVTALKLAYNAGSNIDANGNTHKQIGNYTKTDGTNGTLTDVWFATDLARTNDLHPVAVPAAIAALPDVAGFGNVPSLRQAMARDGTGHLQALVEQYVAVTDATTWAGCVTQIIHA